MTSKERDTYLGGYISLGFFAFGGAVALIVGYLADTLNRKWVFAATVVIGEISCAMTYWVKTETIADFWSGLWLTRAITGVAIGGAIPIQFSLIGDYFGEKSRGKAVSFFAIASGSGGGAGQFLASLLENDWRAPFLIVSVPSFLLVAIFLLTTSEPKRGQAETLLQGSNEPIVQADHKISWSKLKLLFSRPSVALIIMQGLPGCLPWGFIQVFLNDFLQVEKELTNLEAAGAITAFGFPLSVATVLVGIITDRFWQSHPNSLAIFAGATTLAATAPLFIIINAEPQTAGFYAGLMFLDGCLAGFAGTMLKIMLLQITLPETRGTAFAVSSLFDELGKGLGPYMVSAIIKYSPDRQSGLTISVLGWIPTSIMMFLLACFLKSDRKRNEEELLKFYLPKDEINEKSL